ncbi:MAG: MurR/RpiR family transcriptional regulator [Bacteriovoracaceae bacterium]|nr:MurR/RpiR family transcriptional regulator [Bacteriovoracaceae bacterium]
MNVIEKIKSSKLVGSQKDIAAFLTKELHRTAFLSGPEIAEECKVSNSAITRFAQKVGYSGFPELKKELEGLYRNQTTPLEMFESFVSKEVKDSITGLSLSQDIENINRFQSTLNEKNLQKVIKAISKGKTIHLVAIGVAEILVDTLASYLEALDKTVVKLKSFGISKQAELINFNKNDVVICFSFQRILKEVHKVAEYSKEKGAVTIAVTDSETNPLSITTDYTLMTPVSGTTFGMSLVAPLALVNILGNTYAALDKDTNLKKLKRVKKTWDEYPIFSSGPQ